MSIDTAFILAAGRGSRLGALTENTPKPLLPIGGRPVIERLLAQLSDAGIVNVVMNVSYHWEKIIHHLRDGHAFGCQIEYSIEAQRLEIAGGIIAVLERLPERFLVVNADLVTDYPFEQLKSQKLINAEGHLVLVPTPKEHIKGDFDLEQNLVTLGKGTPHYTFSGISVLSQSFFKEVPPGYRPLGELLYQKAALNKLSGELYGGAWYDVGTIERFEQVHQQLLRAEIDDR